MFRRGLRSALLRAMGLLLLPGGSAAADVISGLDVSSREYLAEAANGPRVSTRLARAEFTRHAFSLDQAVTLDDVAGTIALANVLDPEYQHFAAAAFTLDPPRITPFASNLLSRVPAQMSAERTSRSEWASAISSPRPGGRLSGDARGDFLTRDFGGFRLTSAGGPSAPAARRD